MFLEKILVSRRESTPPDSAQISRWQEEAAAAPPTRDFQGALRRGPRPRVIAEFKRASPSKGVLHASLDPVRQARAYARGGASAISVLTEPHFFRGSRSDLEQVRAACDLPVLRKDFLLEDWEIYQSRCWGADAVLLIAAALAPPRLARMLELSRQLGMSALVEVHSAEEASWVRELEPELIGINNRDLKSFHVDLDITRQVLPLLPAKSLRVAESGFETYAQLSLFPEIDAFLIGETLVRASDPAGCLQALRGSDDALPTPPSTKETA